MQNNLVLNGYVLYLFLILLFLWEMEKPLKIKYAAGEFSLL